MEKLPLTQAMRKWLLDQVDIWRDKNLVTADQADSILDLYETPKTSAARQQSVAIYVLLGIAAFFVALAVFLLVSFNWEHLPAAVKLIIIFLTVGGTYAGAFFLRFKLQQKIFSELVFFLGGLFYGAAISLIAQIFHLNAHYPDGLWWWALGILPIALFLDTFLLHLLLVVLLASWIGTEITGAHWLFGRFPSVHGCYTLLGFAGLGLAWAYYKKSPLTVGLYVPLIVFWVVLLPFVWQWKENPIFFIGSAGAVLLLLAEAHEEGSSFAIPYRLWGSVLCMVVLAMLSFHRVHAEVVRFENVWHFCVLTIGLTVFAGGAFLWSAYRQSRRGEDASLQQPLYALALRQWLPLAMASIMVSMTRSWAIPIPSSIASIPRMRRVRLSSSPPSSPIWPCSAWRFG
jgi:uncharacterized membrane protein